MRAAACSVGLGCLVTVGLGLIAQRVEAATVTARVQELCEDDVSCAVMYALRVRARPGERNDIRVSYRHGVLRIRDVGARLRARGSGCELRGTHRATCTAPRGRRAEGMSLDIRTGDEADRVRMSRRRVPYRRTAKRLNVSATTLDGGGGDDLVVGPGELSGGAGADHLIGSSNEDRLLGGPGEDRLIGGAGNDELAGDEVDFSGESPPASPGDDLLDGGAGSDTVYFDSRTEAVLVDLLTGVAGQAGERDDVTAVENATGGHGGTLLGNDGANHLFSGGGGATIEGRGGDDALFGTDAFMISGGPGDDFLVPGASGIEAPIAPLLECGPDHDELATDDDMLAPLLIVPADCEYALTQDFELSLRPRPAGPGSASFEMWTQKDLPVPRRAAVRLTNQDGQLVATGSTRPKTRHFRIEVEIRSSVTATEISEILVNLPPARKPTKIRAHLELSPLAAAGTAAPSSPKPYPPPKPPIGTCLAVLELDEATIDLYPIASVSRRGRHRGESREHRGGAQRDDKAIIPMHHELNLPRRGRGCTRCPYRRRETRRMISTLPAESIA